MKKVKLDLESLRVESFESGAGALGAGTVRALSPHTVPDCSAATCFVSCAVESCTHLCC